ncbi:Protein TRANSPARENT TESTA 12 [Hordeum vulgare]|nr:Protein TRANSPARENT TESTA 12 [Hordeum vulgare]
MSSRCRGSSGYHGVRERPSDTFYAEIRSDNVRNGLGMFEAVHEAVRAYDVMAWRYQRPHAQMNFHDVHSCEQA